MTDTVRRYRPRLKFQNGQNYARMEPEPIGDWMRYSDYEVLQREAATLRAENESSRFKLNAMRGERDMHALKGVDLLRQRDELRASSSELNAVSIRILDLTRTINSHRCSERTKSDSTCGDPGTPPCTLADIGPEEFCDNCKISDLARKDRTAAKRRRSVLVRQIAKSDALIEARKEQK